MPHATSAPRGALPATRPVAASVQLTWLPLGAGGHVVRWNGRLFEAVAAARQHRPACELFHSALDVQLDGDRFVVEMTPVLGQGVAERGVVLEGPVGSRWLGRWPLFRYEVRRWRGGRIGDVASAVAGPSVVGEDVVRARKLLELVPRVPPFVWGRDEAGAGEMWNSNSVTSWLLARSGHDVAALAPPHGGRAPGWHAGLVVAAR